MTNMEENEELDSDFNTEEIPSPSDLWNYMEHYWHNNREFPESTEDLIKRKADLVDGKVPSSQLPSYVDDVQEFDSFENLPNPGEKGKIYMTADNNSILRWNGSEYIQLNLEIDGEIVVNNLSNSTGTILTYNPNTKVIGTRTNTEIISDLGLNSLGYFPRDKETSILRDANDLNLEGVYPGYQWLNVPQNTIGILTVKVYSADWIRQEFAVIDGSGLTYVRDRHSGNAWGLWKAVANQDWAIDFFVTKNYDDNIGGSKKFTGPFTLWQLNNDSNNSLGIIGSGPVNFDIGTINDKNVAIYRNSVPKIIVEDNQVVFNNNISIPNATATNHAVNLGQLTSQMGNYLPLSGGTLTQGGRINPQGSITIQQADTLNATGLFWETMANSDIMAGIGVLTTADVLHGVYMGWGNTPWTSANSLTVTSNVFQYKGYDVLHTGNADFFSKNKIVSQAIDTVTTTLDASLPNGGFIASYNNPSWGGTDRPTGASYGGYIKFSRGSGLGDNNNLDFYYNNGHNGDASRIWFRTKEFVNGVKPWLEFYHSGNFNPDSKVNALENGKGIGFTSGTYPTNNGVEYPYMYHANSGSNTPFVPLATQGYVNTNFQPVGNYVRVGGTGTTGNNILIGWTGSQAQLTVDATIIGNLWHTGNFNPDSKVNKAGDNMTGDLGLSNSNLRVNGPDSNWIRSYKETTGNVGIVAGWEHVHYSTRWKVGNKRGGSTDSLGYAFEFSSNDGATYDEKVLIQPDGNILTSNFGAASEWNAKLRGIENAYAVGFSSGVLPTNTGSEYPYIIHRDPVTGIQTYLPVSTHGYVQTNFIPKTHSAYGITQNNVDNWSSYLGYNINSEIKPSDTPLQKLQFGFGSWNNNNNSPFADTLHFGGHPDSSGGNQNLIVFRKNGFGLRQFQGTSQSPTPYQSFVDYWNTENFTQADIDNWNKAYSWGNHTNAGYATPYWVQSQDYATNNVVNEKVQQITGEFFDPAFPVYIENKFTTIIRTEEYAGVPIDIDGELIPTGNISIINLSKKPLEILRSGKYIDTVLEQTTAEYYITKEQRIIRKGSYRTAELLV